MRRWLARVLGTEDAPADVRPASRDEGGAGAARVDVGRMRRDAVEFERMLRARKATIEPAPDFWYPYGTLANLGLLDALLAGEQRHLLDLAEGLPIADIGAADGDLAFFLEQQYGAAVHIVDHAPTNFNGLRGAHRLKDALGSRVAIHDIDLDQLHALPQERYGLVFFLGILYHLKNPFYALESLARRARHCLVSTRIARFSPDYRTRLERVPVAYLLDATEANNDATNYWIFSEKGLRRLLDRTGWEVLAFRAFGDTRRSNPAAQRHDERGFCLLRSRCS